MIDPSREDLRFGVARWANDAEIERAGLFDKDGLFAGYKANRALFLKSDSPGIVIAGSGAGKGRDWLIETILRGGMSPMLVCDPKGELAAVTIASFIRWKAFVYLWNPTRLHGMVSHATNPLDVLTLSNPNFHSDCADLADCMIPLVGTGGNNAHHFEKKAREWITALLKSLVEQHGHVTMPMLWRMIQAIRSDAKVWAKQLEAMDRSCFGDVTAAGVDIWTAQRHSTSNEFGLIYSTIKAHLSFLNDPTLCAALENPDFSLRDLTSDQLTSLFLMVPRRNIPQWTPVLRLMFTVAMLYKARAPQARRLTMLIDEAGQLGRFEELLNAFTIGRGEGVRTIAVFQDIDQIARNFGREAITGFIGSAQWRCFFGVRDYPTAQLISHMLGNETLEYDDRLQQQNAARMQREAKRRFFQGEDPRQAAYDYMHYREASTARAKTQRALMTPDEILAMPEDQMISFISGLDVPPILANKYPYYTTKSLNGLWLPNPYHPPLDRVKLQGMFGGSWHRVITASVPPELAHFPQYANGRISYVETYGL